MEEVLRDDPLSKFVLFSAYPVHPHCIRSSPFPPFKYSFPVCPYARPPPLSAIVITLFLILNNPPVHAFLSLISIDLSHCLCRNPLPPWIKCSLPSTDRPPMLPHPEALSPFHPPPPPPPPHLHHLRVWVFLIVATKKTKHPLPRSTTIASKSS